MRSYNKLICQTLLIVSGALFSSNCLAQSSMDEFKDLLEGGYIEERIGTPKVEGGKLTEGASPFNQQLGELEGKVTSDIKDLSDCTGDFCKGNDDVDTAWDEDYDVVKDNFDAALGVLSQNHDLETLSTEPEIDINTDYAPTLCFVDFIYQGKNGPYNKRDGICGNTQDSLGTCWLFIGSAYPLCYAIFARFDIIEYYFPTVRLNVSDQRFQSEYLPEDQVEQARELRDEDIDIIKDSINDILKDRLTHGIDSYKELPVAKDGIETSEIVDKIESSATQDAIEKGIEKIKSEAEIGEKAWRAPSNMFMEGRLFPEDQSKLVNDTTYIPHKMKTHRLLTDWDQNRMPADEADGDFYAWTIARILADDLIQLDQYRSAPYLQPLGMYRCAQNNIEDGKTPEDLLPVPGSDKSEFVIEGQGDEEFDGDWLSEEGTGPMLCLDKVGEVFTYGHYARIHGVDAVFQGALKIIQLADVLNEGERDGTQAAQDSPFHTFVRPWDKWFIVRAPGWVDEKLKSEVTQNVPIEEMVKKNVEYSPDTLKKVDRAHETIFSIYSNLKGCYGADMLRNMVGVDEDQWTPVFQCVADKTNVPFMELRVH